MRKKETLVLVLALASGGAAAQSCLTASCNARSASEEDVLDALPALGNSNSKVQVLIPAGTGSWLSQMTYTVPAAVTDLTIQGASSVNCSGTAGTADFTCSAVDKTIFRDDSTSSGFTLWQINGAGKSTSLRVTGITLQGGSGITKGHGLLSIYGPVYNTRIDHMHFNETTYSPYVGSFAGTISANVVGVADHNVYDNGTGGVQTEGFYFENAFEDTIGYGDGPWAKSTPWGSESTFYIESSQINGGMAQDCGAGGSFVLRYNTLKDLTTISAAIHNHGTYGAGGGGRSRSCRFYEAYKNYIVGPATTTTALVSLEGGTALIWGNTLASGYYNFAFVGAPRSTNGRGTEQAPPASWGYCGTRVDSNGAGSQWDGNRDRGTGYPCLDGLGRGQGAALNGQNFPNAGPIVWPKEKLEPIYFFDNSLPKDVNALVVNDLAAQVNRDIYIEKAGFNGTSGTGSGPLSARPSTCSSGPSGDSSPTGSYGVGYFATDANSGAGEFYVCTAANRWTAIYQPLDYPHPLAAGESGGPPGSVGPVASCSLKVNPEGTLILDIHCQNLPLASAVRSSSSRRLWPWVLALALFVLLAAFVVYYGGKLR